MGKAISEKIFIAWCERMAPFLMCFQKDRLEFQFELAQAEKEFEKRNDCELSLNDDFLDGGAMKRMNARGGKKNRKFPQKFRSANLTSP